MPDSRGVALLLLADGRLPAGGHAHSGGVEAAVAGGSVRDLDDLERFLRGRLATAGLVAAAFGAATCWACRPPANVPEGQGTEEPGAERPDSGSTGTVTEPAAAVTGLDAKIAEMDTELEARTPSPAQRFASRAQGRAFLRAGRAAWPDVECPVPAPHHPVAFGLVAAYAGLSPADAALAVAYGAVSGPASAATRLLGLDPLAVTALLARLSADIEFTAAEAAACCERPPADLPARTGVNLELLAERHRVAEIRMFAS